MPRLENKQKVEALRARFHTLTRTMDREVEEWRPSDNVDEYHHPVGKVVFATSRDSDFYALSGTSGFNLAFSFADSNGRLQQIFIFSKMKDVFYQYTVSSENFVPIVAPGEEQSGKGFHGEWVSDSIIKPIARSRKKTKAEILNRTDALVFTIAKQKVFENIYHKLMADISLRQSISREPAMMLQMVGQLAQTGVLKKENPGRIDKLLTKITQSRNLPKQIKDILMLHSLSNRQLVKER